MTNNPSQSLAALDRLYDEYAAETDTRRRKELLYQLLDEVRQLAYDLAWEKLRNVWEDIAQDVVVAVLMGRFRNDGAPFSAYVSAIIENRCRNVYKQLTKRPTVSLDTPDPESLTALQRQAFLSSLAQRRIIGTEMPEYPKFLTPAEREVFDLVVQGYSHAEIAEKTGRQRGTVSGLAHRAKKKLRLQYMKSSVGETKR